MWLAWVETVDIYLCRGVVWYRLPGQAATSLKMPLTLSLTAQLQRLAPVIEPHIRKRARSRIVLGAKLCPPVCYSVPRGLGWNEQRWIALKEASGVWGLPPAQADQLMCVLSTSVTGLAAALPSSSVSAIRSWADSLRAPVTSVAPMWNGFGSPLGAGAKASGGFSIEEPDGTILSLLETEEGCRSVFGADVSGLAAPRRRHRWSGERASDTSVVGKSWSWADSFEAVDL